MSLRAAWLCLPLLAGGCASPGTLRDFTTDGCSLFPDGELGGDRKLWCPCCAIHDVAYWRGGTRAQRLQADREFRDCVAARTGDPSWARFMYLGVRAGGSAALPTWYRWGYGWGYGRGYAPLSEAELETADRKLRDARDPVETACGP